MTTCSTNSVFVDVPTSPVYVTPCRHNHFPCFLNSFKSVKLNVLRLVACRSHSLSSFLASPSHTSHDSNTDGSERASKASETTQHRGVWYTPGLWGCKWSMGFLRCWYCGSHPKLLSVVSLQSLDSWGTSEDADAPSKRHSTSDLSDATFSDIRREGWLYYKQVLTKKGKVRWLEE